MDKQELLPCPFGGDEAQESESGLVRCRNYHCVAHSRWMTKEEWNARPLPALQAAAKGLGMCVVPLEPSEAIWEAGEEAFCASTFMSTNEDTFSDIYRAMLTAAQEDKDE